MTTEALHIQALERLRLSVRSDAEIEAMRAADQERTRLARIEDLRKECRAPLRHLACKPKAEGEWNQKMVVIHAKLGSGALIGLVGGRGSGKTMLGVQAMLCVTGVLRSALFTTAADFFMAIKATYKKDNQDTEADVVAKFRRPSLLVIDEIGKRGETDWENNMLFHLLNVRYNDLKDTIVIDNREKREFIETIGESLASRMNESGGIIECNWKSFRE